MNRHPSGGADIRERRLPLAVESKSRGSGSPEIKEERLHLLSGLSSSCFS
jgi:hypothetical protein